MTAPGKFYPGGRLSGPALRAAAPLAAYKSVIETVSNSNTLQDDDALLVQLAAGAVYQFACVLNYETGPSGTADFKLGWSLPSGASMAYALYGVTGASGSLVATPGWWETQASVPVMSAGSGETDPVSLEMKGTVATSGTEGALQLQWTQHTASATYSTSVLPGSVLLAWQIQ